MATNMQSRRKNMKICQFTMILVGSSGIGKTSFVNTLFNEQIAPNDLNTSSYDNDQDMEKPISVSFVPYTIEREEFGNKLAVTIVETPGFGDSLHNEAGCRSILSYIEDQFDHVLSEESRIKRNPKFQDTRVHALLYFIAPTGHGLKELDILFMKTVGKRVNIIPVIAKSDALAPEELFKFKQRIMEDINRYSIPIFQFPCDDEDQDVEIANENEDLRSLLPFAIVSAENETLGLPETLNTPSKRRGRKYPWGFIEVDNPRHCDFSRLRNVLLNSHLQDLKDITQNVLYENYRTEKLTPNDSNAVNVTSPLRSRQPSAAFPESTSMDLSSSSSRHESASTEDIGGLRYKLKSRLGSSRKDDNNLAVNELDGKRSDSGSISMMAK